MTVASARKTALGVGQKAKQVATSDPPALPTKAAEGVKSRAAVKCEVDRKGVRSATLEKRLLYQT